MNNWKDDCSRAPGGDVYGARMSERIGRISRRGISRSAANWLVQAVAGVVDGGYCW